MAKHMSMRIGVTPTAGGTSEIQTKNVRKVDGRDRNMGLLVQFTTTFTSHLICTQQP